MKAPIRSYSRRGKRGKVTVELVPVKSELDRLHNEFLQNPPTASKAKQTIADYLSNVEKLREANARCRLLAAEQLKASVYRKHMRENVDVLAKHLVQAYGKGPLQIDGVVYDFGVREKRVYLVPRRAGKWSK